MSEHPEVVFVGGVAHSGSSVVAGLLDAHPRLTALSVVAPFHTDDRGLPALLAGQVGLDDFVAGFRERWWSAGDGGEASDPTPLDSELARFREAYHGDPLSACRALFMALAVHEGADRGLVDTSPGNLRQAQTLLRLFPEARFVHVVRDGRDVAASPAEGDGTRLVAGIRSWAARLREIDAALRGEEDGASHPVPADRLAVIVLDRLVSWEREVPYEALLGLLDVEDDPTMRSFAERRLGPREVGRGRWRERARGPAALALGRRYRRTLDALGREGNHTAGPLLDAYEELG